MTRLIDRDELLATFERDAVVSVTGRKNAEEVKQVLQTICDDIKESPVVDAEPVRYGKWKDHKDYPGLAYLCSECGCFTTMRTYRYCPNCGARMDEE